MKIRLALCSLIACVIPSVAFALDCTNLKPVDCYTAGVNEVRSAEARMQKIEDDNAALHADIVKLGGVAADKDKKPESVAATAAAPPNLTPPKLPAFAWVDTNRRLDWGGNDRAFSSGFLPKPSVGGMTLCDGSNVGMVATCWENRPNGYPLGTPTDVTGQPRMWCTYKNHNVNLDTPPNGAAQLGLVHECRQM